MYLLVLSGEYLSHRSQVVALSGCCARLARHGGQLPRGGARARLGAAGHTGVYQRAPGLIGRPRLLLGCDGMCLFWNVLKRKPTRHHLISQFRGSRICTSSWPETSQWLSRDSRFGGRSPAMDNSLAFSRSAGFSCCAVALRLDDSRCRLVHSAQVVTVPSCQPALTGPPSTSLTWCSRMVFSTSEDSSLSLCFTFKRLDTSKSFAQAWDRH